MFISKATLLAALTAPALITAGREAPPPIDIDITIDGFDYNPTPGGFSTGPCLNELYRVDHPESTLTCNGVNTAGVGSGGKFWKRVQLRASPTCVEGRRLVVDGLEFESVFKRSMRDFAVVAYTGESPAFNETLPIVPNDAPVYGDRCVTQTLTSANDDNANALAFISDQDGDTCHDVTISEEGGNSITTPIEFTEQFSVPCTDYRTPDEIAAAEANGTTRTVKLQFCSSWRDLEMDNVCDTIGPHPCSEDACWCGTIDLGVEILDVSEAVPTCSPNHVMDSDSPTVVEVPITPPPSTASPTKEPTRSPVTSEPSAGPTKNPVTSEPSDKPSVSPSKSPSVMPVTSSPTEEPTKSPITKSPVTSEPSASPSKNPVTSEPSTSPSKSPVTSEPSVSPSKSPVTSSPTEKPTKPPVTSEPSSSPTKSPVTSEPSSSPSKSPVTSEPSPKPSVSPSKSPSVMPVTSSPTDKPTKPPVTISPTKKPTESPVTSEPSTSPSKSPVTSEPSSKPSVSPSKSPSAMPVTSSPTDKPTKPVIATPGPTNSPTLIIITDDTESPTASPTKVTPKPAPVTLSPSTAFPTTSPIEDQGLPFAIDDRLATCINTTAVKDVIENDDLIVDRPLKLKSIVVNGDDGACVKTSSTDVTYFPNPNFVGSDKCIYEACEFNMNTGEWFTDATCVQATIRITVSGPGIRGCPSPAPTTSPTAGAPTSTPTCDDIKANDNSVTTPKDTKIFISVLDNDVTVPGYNLTISSLPHNGTNGVCKIVNDGQDVEYTPNSNFYGQDSCVYEVCDDKSLKPRCDIATVSITVLPSPDDPVANDDDVTTEKNKPVDVSILLNDEPVAGHDLTVRDILTGAEHGECVVVSDQIVKYIPEPDFAGLDSCVYEACDDRVKCDSATIYVNITGEPEGPCDDDKVPTLKPTPDVNTTPTGSEVTVAPTMSTPTTKSPTLSPSGSPICSGEPCSSPSTNITITSTTPAPSGSPSCGGEKCSSPTTNITITSPTPAPSATIEIPLTPQPSTSRPSLSPSTKPTPSPTASPSKKPTAKPTLSPSASPSQKPSASPSKNPTAKPTLSPSASPSKKPTNSPSGSPTTPAPTNCEGRKWWHGVWDGCKNAPATGAESGTTMFDTLEECCAVMYPGSDCESSDSCTPPPTPEPTTRSPTVKPTANPTAKPVAPDTLPPTPSPAENEIQLDTLPPTPSPVANIPVSTPKPSLDISLDTPAPTSVVQITLIPNGKDAPTPAPTKPVADLTLPPATNAPSWGGTPTVGTDTTKAPISSRPRKLRKLRNMM